MQRRDFIAGLGAVGASPLAARAQQPALRVIGFLGVGSADVDPENRAAYHRGLSEIGYVEGQNVAVEYRWANSERNRLPELAADLVRRRVAVITAGGVNAPLAVKALTTTIPVVFLANAQDPIQSGLVASLNRPGGNLTGVYTITNELGPKQLGLLHDLLPTAKRFALLIENIDQSQELVIANLRSAAATIGCQIEAVTARNNREIDAAFATILQNKAEALIVNLSALFAVRRAQILTLAARHAVPTIYAYRLAAVAGGLMSYGPSTTEQWRQVGIYTGRILKGEKPADLPVQQPTKFELVINLNTAKALGLTIPETLLATADEVIQ